MNILQNQFYKERNTLIKTLTDSIENLSELRDDLINVKYEELINSPELLDNSNPIAKKILDNVLELVNIRMKVMEKDMEDEAFTNIFIPDNKPDKPHKIDSNVLFENFMNNTMNNFNYWNNQEFYSKEFLSNFF